MATISKGKRVSPSALVMSKIAAIAIFLSVRPK